MELLDNTLYIIEYDDHDSVPFKLAPRYYCTKCGARLYMSSDARVHDDWHYRNDS